MSTDIITNVVRALKTVDTLTRVRISSSRQQDEMIEIEANLTITRRGYDDEWHVRIGRDANGWVGSFFNGTSAAKYPRALGVGFDWEPLSNHDSTPEEVAAWAREALVAFHRDYDSIYLGTPPERSFLDEFTEVWADIAVDLRVTMLDMDEQVGLRTNAYVLELFKLGGTDANEIVRHLMSGMLWMFMAGREHAQRGYAAPVSKLDQDSGGWVPDTLEGIFGRNA